MSDENEQVLRYLLTQVERDKAEIERLRAALTHWDDVIADFLDAEAAWNANEITAEAYGSVIQTVADCLYDTRAALKETET